MSIVADYAEQIVRRAREPMEPLNYHPDWADKPLRHKVFHDVLGLELPDGPSTSDRSLGAVLFEEAVEGRGAFDLQALGSMLRNSYGLLKRRIGPTGNEDSWAYSRNRDTTWGRGTANGGGLYPLEIYWVSGQSGPMMSGVYHYSTPGHAMERLLVGDVSDRVRRAVGDVDDAAETDQFLLVTVKFWQNSFKYNSFCYHVVTMDGGALLSTWSMWARANGVDLLPILCFEDEPLNRLLGVEAREESVLAVVPLPWDEHVPDTSVDGSASRASADDSDDVHIECPQYERSQTVRRFPQVEDVHIATLGGGGVRPSLDALREVAAPIRNTNGRRRMRPVSPQQLPVDVTTALRLRRSSFGALTALPELSSQDFGTILASAAAGRAWPTDLTVRPEATCMSRIAVIVNHVDDVVPGAYDYEAATHELSLVASGAHGGLLQRNYFLNNYNVEQAAAVILVMSRPRPVIEHLGDRAIRFLNAEVGAVAQTTYTACAAIGVGCGAALGFDNVTLAELLQAGEGEWPLLLIFVGNERTGRPDMDYRLV